jgi:protein-arginine kinase activator protein McsA
MNGKDEDQKIRFLSNGKPDICEEYVLCPNCGAVVKYGDLRSCSGYYGCGACYDSLEQRIDFIRKNDYDYYKRHNMYRLTAADYYAKYSDALVKWAANGGPDSS